MPHSFPNRDFVYSLHAVDWCAKGLLAFGIGYFSVDEHVIFLPK